MTTAQPGANRERMARARAALQGRWGLAIGGCVLFLVVTCAAGLLPVIGPLLIAGPMSIGLAVFSLSLSRTTTSKPSEVFDGFDKFGVGVGAFFLKGLFTFLWSLLFVIPGIIAAFSYAMTYFILAEETIRPLDAITKSKQMMRGHKWELFCLGLRFTGWFLLCILSCGIGFLWLVPYIAVSLARFYDDIRTPATIEPVVAQ